MNLPLTLDPSNLPPSMPAGKAKAIKAAQDFEAVLLTSVLDALQKSFADSSSDAPAGSDNYGAMGIQSLASTISANGGIGIARMILRQWHQTKVPELSGREVTSAT
ncbi:MAG TPA: rod-binding protein [Terriglobales bacterium]|jgi:Rod binding domain-containing protein|nr:rod-binding protein [Terriglobales bacterium]